MSGVVTSQSYPGSAPFTGTAQPKTKDPFGQLNDTQRSAYGVVLQMLQGFGLNGLAQTALNYIRKGYDDSTVSYLLTQTDQYKQRFSGNEQRIKNGLPALSPAEYISNEEQYRQLFRTYGVPKGAFDSHDQLANYIAGDVAPTEIKDRLDMATQHIQQADPGMRQALSAYGIDSGHLLAYALDQKTALPFMQQKFAAADIGAAAARQGLAVTDQASAMGYAAQGVTANQAQQAYGQIAQVLPQDQILAQRYGAAPYTQGTAEQEFLGQNGAAATARQQLQGQEKAAFSGQGGVGNNLYHLGYGLSTDESSF